MSALSLMLIIDASSLPCVATIPANFQINYGWKDSAEATGEPNWEWNRGGNVSKTKYELNFDPAHPYITMVSVQHTDDVSASIKIKKLTLVSANEENKLYIVPQLNRVH